ncbi:ABC transporter permease [Desulfitobacterium sp.]|uniref:ABC transporter permease n=1 Tax=Desulfitobacterium sp. TaxID=49981 RepID=UPI002B21A602|nr:ABC transporter permease [Desulfitobacterium sp.]MEA4901566.1 ABC transporter permease [Desulfitobacterium sp.]
MKKLVQGIITPLIAIGIAVMIGALGMILTGHDPLQAYSALFKGAFGSKVNFANTLANAVPLILSGLGIAVTFKAGLFNIGAEGQYWMGSMAAVWIGYSVTSLPPVLHVGLAFLVSMIVAGLWAGIIPGLTKALVGAHEVITTMMMSYIAIFLSHYMLEGGPMMAPGYTPQSPVILPTAELGILVERTQLSWGIIVALAAAVIVYWVIYKTTLGFRLRTVGLNPRAAKYAGINVSLHMVLALFISGALAGLAGAVQMLGVQHRLYDSFSSGYGYTAIVVALLANNNPIGVILAAIFFAALATGGQAMQIASGVPAHLTEMISGIIIFLVAAKELGSVFRHKPPLKHNLAENKGGMKV